jgi:hypothetical protein
MVNKAYGHNPVLQVIDKVYDNQTKAFKVSGARRSFSIYCALMGEA